MIPALNRLLLQGLVGGVPITATVALNDSGINEQQRVHIWQGLEKLNEGADHPKFFGAGLHHPHMVACH